MKLTIHRGTRQIGGTCVELTSGSTRIILDMGIPLSSSDGESFNEASLQKKSVAELIKDGTLFNIPGLYTGEAAQINGLFISHSHKDHYGLLNFINPAIPVYVSDGSNKLIQISSVFGSKQNVVTIQKPIIIEHKKSVIVGVFQITPDLVDHSGFDAMAFLIEEIPTGKRLFYSGDFRASGWKKNLFDSFIKNPPKNIDCLLLEGTTIERDGGKYENEEAVQLGVKEALTKANHNVVLAYSAGQNIDRIVSFYKATRSSKANLVIDPYIATILHVLAEKHPTLPQMGSGGIKVLVGDYNGHNDKYVNIIAKSKYKYLVQPIGRHKIHSRDIGKVKSLVLMRNTMIPLIKRIPHVKGSALIYSLWDGYVKDKAKSKEFWDFIQAYELKLDHIHTSGHANLSVLKQLVNALNPQRIIPIHTASPEKFSEHFGENVMMMDDGQTIEMV